MPSPLQGFDQVVAITQDNINGDLYNFFNLTPALATLKASGGWGEIDATMAPATVLLYAPNEPFKISFCVNLSSGTCKWPRPDSTSTSKFYTASINNWSLVFTVDLSLDEIHKIPSAIASKITVPGSYSLNQLLLDFTTAKLSTFNPTLSKTPGVDEQDPSRASAFGRSMAAYLAQLAQDGGNVIGYAITVPPVVNPFPPSFPPVSVQFQTMQNKDAQGNPGPDGLNCFLFLEMTSKDRTPPKSITWTQNWADKGMIGSIVISKANFWDRFFLPGMTSFNSGAVKMVNQLAHTLDNDSFNSAAVASWSITDKEPSGTELSYSTKGTFTWSHDAPGYTPTWYNTLSGSNNTETVIAPKASRKSINATATSHVSRNRTASNPGTQVPPKQYQSSATVKWGCYMGFPSILDGRLDHFISLIPPKSTVAVKNKNVSRLFGPSDEELSATAQDALKKRVDDASTSGVLNGICKPDGRFVFPGGGQLSMRDPTFNSDEDLAVNLEPWNEYLRRGGPHVGNPFV